MRQEPASYGHRVAAYLIDFLITWVPPILIGSTAIAFLFSDSLSAIGVVLLVVAIVYAPAMGIYNAVIRQGTRGQTIGKSRLGTSLIRETTGLPVGAGWALLRVFLAWVLGSFTGGIYTLVDYVFPAFDSRKQRVTDKMLQMLVVNAHSTTKGRSGNSGPVEPLRQEDRFA